MVKDYAYDMAWGFAAVAHYGQKYGTEPYIRHCEDVAGLVWLAVEEIPSRPAPPIVQAALLHDTLEDTDVTYEQLVDLFGEEVGGIVEKVTDEPGKNRKERKTRTLPKIATCQDAITVKVADRLANVRNCWATKSPLLFVYHKEYPAFRKALRGKSHPRDQKMWLELDKLMGRRQ